MRLQKTQNLRLLWQITFFIALVLGIISSYFDIVLDFNSGLRCGKASLLAESSRGVGQELLLRSPAFSLLSVFPLSIGIFAAIIVIFDRHSLYFIF